MSNDKNTSNVVSDNLEEVIMSGITFRGAGRSSNQQKNDRVKTKARKKGYVTGAHGSASARKKEDIRKARANRHKK